MENQNSISVTNPNAVIGKALLDPFEYQSPTEESVEKIKVFRIQCKSLHSLIMETLPPSRERSLAITKLEEVSMWGNKAIVFNQ